MPLSEITASATLNVSTTIVRTTFHKAWFYSRIATKKLFLSDRHIAGRLAFTKMYQLWKHVIWTNKFAFKIGKNSWHILVWKRTDEYFKLDSLASILKLGCTSIIVWGAFIASKKVFFILMPSRRHTPANYFKIVYNRGLEPFLMFKKTSTSWC